MRGKTVVITGATSGIGKVAAHELARDGAEVVLVGRDAGKLDERVAAIRAETPDAKLVTLRCDFARRADVLALADELARRFSRIDVLANNAGAIHGELELTADGLERTIAVNHVGYFVLTVRLGELLMASRARVVNVASSVHGMGRIDVEGWTRPSSSYQPMGAYAESKLANVLFSAALARRLEGSGATSNALHPGAVSTGFGNAGPAWMRFGLKLGRYFLMNEKRGADTLIYLMRSPEVAGVSGRYFVRRRAVSPAKSARDVELQERLFAETERLTGVRWEAPVPPRS